MKKTKCRKIIEKLKKAYHSDDVAMGEIMASFKADGISLEEAFYLYIWGMNWANGDEFIAIQEEQETLDLVEEAKRFYFE